MNATTDLNALFAMGKTPGELGFVMPIETSTHACCWMAWPHDDHPDAWGRTVSAVQRAFVRVATAISRFEPVRVVAHPEVAADARRALPANIDVVGIPQDDIWFRDTGPLFVKNSDNQLVASNLVFNNWGGKFHDNEAVDDAGVGAALARHLSVPLYASPLCGEGGGIHVDGDGTAITTETCLLNANRNAGMSRKDVENELFHALGVRKVIWLPGDDGEWITDGHIDGMMTICAPGKVIFENNPDSSNPRHEVCQENLRALRAQTDAKGRAFDIGLIEEAHMVEAANDHTALSYVNAYIANGGVVMPGFNTPTDDAARHIFERGFPGREIVQVEILDICPAGGGIHCITQQQPA
ncbi:agmatine deiminase family protein [Aminobacter sp. BA135]|uniref:agmatine deiminase family protein n=1 Tax=Aminobacter sp. BA135 TaxID=537596 RepID=UPI003D7A24E7